jgi:hypothetical protein
MSTNLVQPAALACFVGALILGLRRGVTQSSGADRIGDKPAPDAAGGARLATRLARRYDRSSFGNRLASRLWSAQLFFTPAAWRAAQFFVAVPLATLLLAAGAQPGTAVGVAISLVRAGGSLLLWLRRGRVRDAIDWVAPLMARALATQLSTWGSGGLAVARAADRCRTSPSPGARAVTRLLDIATLRVALGGEAGDGLQRSVQDASPRPSGMSAAAVVADIFALYRHDAAATASALERLARALEDDRAVRREARAAVGDVRTSAVAVPAVAAATGVLLLTADPPALAAALTTPLLPLLAVAAALVCIAVVGVRRLVAV